MTPVRHSIENGMFIREAPGSERPRGTIVFLHGLGESGLCFEGILVHPELAAWRRISVDLPGYGRSPWREGPLSLTEQADHVVTWIRSRAIAPVVLVGHSMGGVSGLYLCERHPECVLRFVNVEGNLTIGDCSYSKHASAYSREEFLDHGFRALLDRLYGEGASDAPHRGYFASMRHCDPAQYWENALELIEVSSREEPVPRIAALDIPVTHIPGVPGGNAKRSLELLTEAGIPWTAVEPAGHWPYLDRPDDFARVMRSMIESDPTAEPGGDR